METYPYRTTEQKPKKTAAELLNIIEIEEKFGILLPKNAHPGFEIKQLTQLKNLNSSLLYKDIVLYSEEFGILHLNKNLNPEQDYSEKPIHFATIAGASTKLFLDFIDENHSTVVTITYNPLAKNFTVNAINKDPSNIRTVFEK